MPIHSFVPSPDFGAPAPTPPAPRKPRAPKRKRKAKPRPRRVLTPQVRTLLIDRLEAAIEDGRVALCDEDMPCESLDLTIAELAFLQEILFPEEYPEPKRAAKPTGTAPGSAERIAEYAGRVARGRAMTVAADASATGAHAKGLKIVQRANGSGVKVVGWQEEEE